MKYLLLLTTAILFLATLGIGQIPHTLSHQGYVADSLGKGYSGTLPMSFRIYPDSSGGAAVLAESFPSVTLTKGVFNVTLDVSSLSFTKQYWLETEVNGQSMVPRMRLTSAPYSLAPWATADTSVYYNAGNVGIGTSAPDEALVVVGKTKTTNLQILNGAGPSKILQSDASGTASWVDPASVGATGSAGGDLKGTYPNPTIDSSAFTGTHIVTAVNASSATIDAARLPSALTAQGNTFNGTGELVKLDASGKLPAVDGSQLTNMAAAPSGSAGGDLNGSYPNPTLDSSATTGAHVVTALNASSATIDAARLPSTMTAQGNTFNGVSELVKLDAGGKLPAVDGSQLTNMAAAPTGTAGGDLTGTFPSPTIGSSATTGANIVTAVNASSASIDAARLQSTVTTQGNTFNGNSQLVQLDGTGKLPAVNGSQLTNLSATPSGTAGGDLSGSFPSPSLSTSAATGGNVVTAINASSSSINAARLQSTVTTQGNTFNGNSQLVQLDGTGKLPAVNGSQLTNIAAAPSGTAGGDLSGTYPSPSLSTSATTGGNVVTAINASAGSINAARLQTTVTTQGNTFNGASQLVKLDASGLLPAVNGSQLTNISAAPTGTAGGDITGTYPNPTLKTTAATGSTIVTAINASTGAIDAARLQSTVTAQGNTFNGVSQLVKLDASGRLPAVNASLLTNLPAASVNGGVFAMNFVNPASGNPFYASFVTTTTTPLVANIANIEMIVPVACTLDRFFVTLADGNGTAQATQTTIGVTVMVNGANSTLAVSGLVSPTAVGTYVSGSDLTHSVSVNAGDRLLMIVSTSSNTPIIRIMTSLRYR